MEPLEIIEKARKEGRKVLLEPESKRICASYGIPVTIFDVAKDEDEAVEKAKRIGFPIVMKIVSPDILHKSDAGGVIVGVKNEEEVRKCFRKIIENVKKYKPNARIYGMLIQEMAPQGIETIVGCIKDPQFGHAVMFGLGGVFVEVLKDVSFRITPLTVDDAKDMIKDIKGYPILMGYRGQKPADIDSLVDIILKVSRMVEELKVISQMDLNPVFVYEKGAKVIDARIIVS
ncbi:MAG: acetyl-CoA synthetase [Thermofilum sp. ex4484_15]|nr:MAG: acetyl-CoA synthetase [Thermofilum sp. ex4484_15]